MVLLATLLVLFKPVVVYLSAGALYGVLTGLTWADAATYIGIASLFLGTVAGAIKVIYVPPSINLADLRKDLEDRFLAIEKKQASTCEAIDMDIGAINSKIEVMDKSLEVQKTKTGFLEQKVTDLEEDVKNSLIRIEDKLDANHQRVVDILLSQNAPLKGRVN